MLHSATAFAFAASAGAMPLEWFTKMWLWVGCQLAADGIMYAACALI